jgi:hypothetical protein
MADVLFNDQFGPVPVNLEPFPEAPFCNTYPLTSPYTSAFCTNYCTNANVNCDKFIIPYCKNEGRNDPICGCINSTVANPACNDPKCSASGTYGTHQMLKDALSGQTCPLEPIAVNPRFVTAAKWGALMTRKPVTPLIVNTAASCPPNAPCPPCQSAASPMQNLFAPSPPPPQDNTQMYIIIAVLAILLLGAGTKIMKLW